MRPIYQIVATSLFILFTFSLSPAQNTDFALASGRVGEVYEQSIQRMLAEKYSMKLESGSRATAFEWMQVDNLPPGLKLNRDGMITGVPQSRQEQPYRFRVKVIDLSMRDAESLEMNLNIQILAPRIRLVSTNAPRLVPIDRATGQTSNSAESPTSVSGGSEARNGVSASALSGAKQPKQADNVAPSSANQLESSPFAYGNTDVAPQGSSGRSPDPQPTSQPTLQADIGQYIVIMEESGGNSTTIYPRVKKMKTSDKIRGSGSSTPISTPENRNTPEIEANTIRLFAKRKSSIIIRLAASPIPNNDDLVISAELPGGNSPEIIGLPVDNIQSGRQTQTSARLTRESPIAVIDLEKAGAKKGDVLTIEVSAFGRFTTIGPRPFSIELDDYAFEQGLSPSLFLVNRPGVNNPNIPSVPQTDMSMTNGQPMMLAPADITNPVNYSPSAGINYLFTYRPKPDKGAGWRALSLLQPGFGVNATFMDFNDQTLDMRSVNDQTLNMRSVVERFLRNESDVQLGVGAALSFFGNNVQLTYGRNLNVERNRSYFAFGVDFLKLFNLIRQ